MIVGFGDRVVESDCVGFVVAPNGDAVERVIFCVGARRVIVFAQREVSDGEKFNPRFGVGLAVVDAFKRSGEFASCALA